MMGFWKKIVEFAETESRSYVNKSFVPGHPAEKRRNRVRLNPRQGEHFNKPKVGLPFPRPKLRALLD